MGRVGFVFSGQGDQYSGMGRDLYAMSPAAARVFHRCEELRPDTIRQCFSGSAEELRETVNTQPCLFALELAGAAALKERGICPDAVAGFSLGEVAAATAAGLFTPDTGFRLVMRRGELMQQAAQAQDTAMAAVLKLTEEQVAALCAESGRIYPVNFNCPGQITVAGAAADLPEFQRKVKAAGGRALPLKVRGAFHSPYMKGASESFAEEMRAIEPGTMEIPLYSNVTARVYEGDPRDLLARQIASPVLWEKLIRSMVSDGVDTFIEIGPGRTLTGMIGKIDPSVTAVSVADWQRVMEVAL